MYINVSIKIWSKEQCRRLLVWREGSYFAECQCGGQVDGAHYHDAISFFLKNMANWQNKVQIDYPHSEKLGPMWDSIALSLLYTLLGRILIRTNFWCHICDKWAFAQAHSSYVTLTFHCDQLRGSIFYVFPDLPFYHPRILSAVAQLSCVWSPSSLLPLFMVPTIYWCITRLWAVSTSSPTDHFQPAFSSIVVTLMYSSGDSFSVMGSLG